LLQTSVTRFIPILCMPVQLKAQQLVQADDNFLGSRKIKLKLLCTSTRHHDSHK